MNDLKKERGLNRESNQPDEINSSIGNAVSSMRPNLDLEDAKWNRFVYL